ncbi:hypothetical protein BWQ96_10220 [Gracilariopsis chorda]|uniref:Uncharacterized protein n=1 Tax=Gracilariopsis chorda TaxID=448386 RepID=A0A2V3IDA8_9FLOR|nr:hypothetical protein BWQ96_10220 [Gracilariopsis chorda]|eukprot:PXF40069.1 hypothetical protein BWQ96_10220 [Gracilariopsis chorda]
MVARVPAFTSGLRNLYDKRGWNCVHLDDVLEMLIVRLLKGLNVSMLQYQETAGAWLLVVSTARMLIRSVTGASRSYHLARHPEGTVQDFTSLSYYDKNAVQCRTVNAMLQLMPRKRFLSTEQRSSENHQNMLGERIEELNDEKVQKLIIDIQSYGEKSAELHALLMFPEILGPFSDSYITEHFN